MFVMRQVIYLTGESQQSEKLPWWANYIGGEVTVLGRIVSAMTVAYMLVVVKSDWDWAKEQWVLSSQRLAEAKAVQNLESGKKGEMKL